MANQKKNANEFDKILQELGESVPTPYTTESIFSVGEFIEHKVFGIGKVINLIAPNKLTVHFMNGPKILICGYSQSL